MEILLEQYPNLDTVIVTIHNQQSAVGRDNTPWVVELSWSTSFSTKLVQLPSSFLKHLHVDHANRHNHTPHTPHTHTHTYPDTRMLSHACTHTETHTHRHTRTHIHTHTYIHTHIHTDTQTLAFLTFWPFDAGGHDSVAYSRSHSNLYWDCTIQ